MNYIKYLKYIMSAALMLCLMPGLTSCEDDIVLGGEDGNDYDTVSLKIQLPEPTVVNPMSRAEAADFDKVNDLNILVCSGVAVKKCIYLDGTKLPQTEVTTGTETDGITITSKKDKYGYMEYTIDFALNFWAGLGAKPGDCDFYAVANHGSEITETSLDAVKALKVNAEITTINSVDHATPSTPNVMFGEQSASTEDKTDPSITKKLITISLKRTAAMITLQLNGEGLSDNVVIELQSVELRNVPNSCVLGVDNTPNDHATQISSYGDYKGGPSISGGYKLIGTGRQDKVGGYTTNDGYKTIIGGHYPKYKDVEGNEQPIVSDVTDAVVVPLFMFENRQPKGVSGGGQGPTQVHKRPNDQIQATETAIANYNEKGVCSYIEVVGNYTKYDQENLTNISERGTATWRFFLGKDTETDFDVERNSNYRITLTLKGSGIGEDGYSWRVDAPLTKPEVVGNPNMVVGGGGEMFCVEFTKDPGDNPNMKVLYEYTENGVLQDIPKDFVYAFMNPKGNNNLNDYYWEGASKPGSSAYFWYLTAEKQLWFYVSPLMPADEKGENEDLPGVTERSCKITFQSTNGKDTYGTITFTQYKPVLFSVTKDDLVNHDTDPDLMRAYELMQKYYKVDVEANGTFRFWADRIDRDPMPWGFSGVKMDKNQHTGFENVYHLVKPKDENYKEETCPIHIAYAGHYLPTGKGFREEKPNTDPVTYESYIDYSRGSCMMHAVMENHFQQYIPKPANDVTPDDMLSVTVDNIVRPGEAGDNTGSDRRFSWCVPSVVGCQIVELLDRYYKRNGDNTRGFDTKYPIVPWVSYWTSNAATNDMGSYYDSKLAINGENRSFVYQFDTGLENYDYTFDMNSIDNGTGTLYPARLILPRASSIKYRLLNIRPADAN